MNDAPRRLALAYPASLMVAGAGVLLAAYVLAATGLPQWLALALIACGFVLWTLLEYLLHRFVLHRVEPFKAWHAHHHRVPDEPIRIPLAFSVPLVLVLLIAPALLLRNVAFSAALSLGLLVGEMLQEAVHDRVHRGAGGGLLAARRRHHGFHHTHDERRGFGTLSGFWDRCLGTAPPG
ncbi:sterol desaturase family protein [Thauera sp. WH-1]|uniref:sterol desaturase family protein n=1 Tax=Thauera sp. WH-1 TaxID=3398230 RepID=UPI0039FCB195